MMALALLVVGSAAGSAYAQQPDVNAGCLIEAANVTIEQTQPFQWHRSLLVVGTAAPRIGWQVGLTPAAPATTKDQAQSTYHITATDPASGKVLWDSGKVSGKETLGITWGGAPLPSRQRVEVKVEIADGNGNACQPSAPVTFETGLLHTTDWTAEWIGTSHTAAVPCRAAPPAICCPHPVLWPPDSQLAGPPVARNSSDECAMYADDPAPTFRKTFETKSSAVKSARLYATGLGYYRLHLNGERVGDGALEPVWTAFATRVFYSSYDVTDLLTKQSSSAAEGGAGTSHVLAAELGKGWWDPLPLKFCESVAFCFRLSRACLGKCSVLIRNWVQNG
jgi:alpha-L-rhamnosidase